MHVCACTTHPSGYSHARTHTYACTHRPISNTYSFSTATVIRQRALMLRYTYIACLIITTMDCVYCAVRTKCVYKSGPKMAQSVSRPTLRTEARARTQSFVVDRVTLGQFFLRVLLFSLSASCNQNSYLPKSICYSYQKARNRENGKSVSIG